MERIRLDQHTLKIELAEQLAQHRPLVVFAGGVASLADRHAQSGGVQRDLGNERRSTTSCGLNRASQGLIVTDQLIEIRCAAWDLGDRPVTDRRAERRHVRLVEEVTKRGIRWRPPQLHAQRLGFEFSGGDAEETNYNRIRSLVNEELKQYFRPEFLNRLDEIIVFRQLSRDEVKEISEIMLKSLRKNGLSSRAVPF